jgi:hypothetical protein
MILMVYATLTKNTKVWHDLRWRHGDYNIGVGKAAAKL